jgi:tetratricopeptide (TPR) repeat protein
MTRRDRYPGARPFADDPIDQWLYFGRPREAEELFHRILAAPLLVLYGQSGLGKTSLLQAGVFPRLRERDLLPVPVRLNRPEVTPLAAVRETLERTCQAQGIVYTPVAADDLWTLLKSAVLWRGDALQTPVLVLDQFEELFTLHPPEGRQRWALAIAELVDGRPPAAIRERLRAGERLPFGEGPPAVKLVLSLREDHLGGLEELAAEVPSVLENRLRLTALDREAARAAICEPAGLPQGEDLASPPLAFSADALTGLLDFLEGKSRIIEPFQLQVLCRHLERQAAGQAQGATEVRIEAADLGGVKGMAAVLAGFYRDALAALPRRRERRRARELCEWGLLSQDGRRLPMDQAEIRHEFGVGPETLQRLVDARLLRSEPRLEGLFYELSHDTLAETALRNRRWRLPRGVKYGLAAMVLLLVLALVVLQATERERRRADLARTEAEGLIEFMLIDLRDKLQPVGRLDLLKDLNARVDTYYQRLGVDARDREMQRRRSVALNNHGDTLRAQGDLAGALTAYEEGKTIRERLTAADPSNTGWQHDLSESLNRVGDIKAVQGNLGGALAAYEKGKTIRERLAVSDPSNTGWQHDLSESLNKVGDIQAGLGYLLLVNLHEFGDIRAAPGDLAQALAVYEESKLIRKRLAVTDPNNADWQRYLAASLEKIGDIKAVQGNLAGALAAYKEGKQIFERLTTRDPNNANWRRDLAVSLNQIGNIMAAQGDLDEALAAHEKAKVFMEQLTASDKSNMGWQFDLSVSQDMIGHIRADQKELGVALADYEAGKAIRERLVAEDPSNVVWQTGLAVSLWKLSQEGLAKRETAIGYLRRALEVLGRLESEGKLNAQQKDWPEQVRQRLHALEAAGPGTAANPPPPGKPKAGTRANH